MIGFICYKMKYNIVRLLFDFKINLTMMGMVFYMKKMFYLSSLITFILVISGCSKLTSEEINAINSVLNQYESVVLDEDILVETNINGVDISWYLDGQIQENGVIHQQNLGFEISKESELKACFDGVERIFTIDSYTAEVLVSEVYLNLSVDINDIDRYEYSSGFVNVFHNEQHLSESLSMQIRGRGNSTWGLDKKSYRIKFDDRQSILGMEEAKDYVLLADHSDKSLLRTFSAHQLSSYLNIGYSIETRFVELYINYEYNGFYILTEQIEDDENRLNIDASIDVDSGYLLELETSSRLDSAVENIDYIKVNDDYYVIKEPNLNDYSYGEAILKSTAIKDDVQAMYDSAENGLFSEIIDVDSFIDFFCLQEIFKNTDVGYSSVNLYKIDNLITMGPLWDFDISCGNTSYIDYSYEGIYVTYNKLIRSFFNNEVFEQMYANRMIEISEIVLDQFLADLFYVQEQTFISRNNNFDKWDILDIYVWPNPDEVVSANTVELQDLYLNRFLLNRTLWLAEYYNNILV